MADDNAYAPVEIIAPVAKPRTRWLRRFVVLNSLLLGIPLLFMATAWLALSSNGTQLSGTSGSIGLATIATIVGYVAVPNLVMLRVWYIRRARTP